MRGETRLIHIAADDRRISIHSPHARGDKNRRDGGEKSLNFNPLPSCEGRQTDSVITADHIDFNPLPSCEGRHRSVCPVYQHSDFNPLPSCEGRPSSCVVIVHQDYFNPLPSCEGRPSPLSQRKGVIGFQSTPLMRGETCTFHPISLLSRAFQSTPLMRGETTKFLVFASRHSISIHSPHARGDPPQNPRRAGYSISIHSPHARGDSRQ